MINFLTSLLGSRLRLYSLAAVAVALGLAFMAYKVQSYRLDACTASIEQANAMGQIARQNGLLALERYQATANNANRRLNQTLRSLSDVKDTDTSPAIGAATGLLCNQGATGCAAN